MAPTMSRSPDWLRPGVSPTHGPTSFDLRNRPGSSDRGHEGQGYDRADPGHGHQQPAHRILPGQGADQPLRPGQPAAQIRPRAQDRSGRGFPASRCRRSTPGHGPRSGPSRPGPASGRRCAGRRAGDSSRSMSASSTDLREVSSARISCDDTDLQCTGRNQPICNGRARPSPSRRAVLTGIAFSAAFTCRVSIGTVPKPASAGPSCRHWDSSAVPRVMSPQ